MRDDEWQSAGDDQPSRRDDANEGFPESGHEDGAPGESEQWSADRRERASSQHETETQSHRGGHESAPRQRTPGESDVPNWVLYVWDLASSVVIVALIGALLFTASGIWPPMVAVESGSMEPTLERGDLVFVMESDRFPGPNAHETGIVTARAAEGTGYTKFDGPGDVVVYEPDGNERDTPVIHRAMFWVEEGENWVEKADPEYLNGNSVCERGSSGNRVPNCPAPHDGFITKGDANPSYDQVSGIADSPVKPKWIIGTAELSVPYLGNIRLSASASATPPTNTNLTASGEAMTNATG
ncbi:S26 family signal peptidase [Halapricum salinum]|nr:S26 family signal peptidase [Halapricum salinum]